MFESLHEEFLNDKSETEIVEEELSTETVEETETETVVEEEVEAEATFSAQDAENMINARLETFTMAVESLVEMTKAIADSNTQINNELSSLKSEFETFKRQPSVETRENEKFSRVGNLTTRQAFLIKNK